jgi:hypothetical protein
MSHGNVTREQDMMGKTNWSPAFLLQPASENLGHFWTSLETRNDGEDELVPRVKNVLKKNSEMITQGAAMSRANKI